jgi:hypothetical protein
MLEDENPTANQSSKLRSDLGTSLFLEEFLFEGEVIFGFMFRFTRILEKSFLEQ